MRSFKITLLITGFLFFFFAVSCKKSTPKLIDFKYGYFPIDTGHYVIYDADSITYNNFYNPTRIDTVSFQIKEVITTVFLDNTGTPAYRIQGYRRSTPNNPWVVYYTWYSNRYTSTAQKTEEPLKYIKLLFPPALGVTWFGNSYIDCVDTNAFLAGWNYYYENIDVPLTLTSTSGTLSSDSTLTVLQDSTNSLQAYTYSVEKYAKNVGLVYKQLTVLADDSSTLRPPSVPWPQRANNGFIYTLSAVSYNK